MFIYIIKCCNFYKIGYSKNPTSRRATIQTHNPLDVKICATLKTEKYKTLEKELHNLFSLQRTRGEWFELKHDHLLQLKIDYGFNFKIPISTINEDESFDNTKNKIYTKKHRVEQEKEERFTLMFEELFSCKIKNTRQIKKCCLKFDSEIIDKSINTLFTQDMSGESAYNILYKVCSNIHESIHSPAAYIAKIVKAIYYKHYEIKLESHEIQTIESDFNIDLNIDDVVKDLNSKKFYLKQDEYWDYLNAYILKY